MKQFPLKSRLLPLFGKKSYPLFGLPKGVAPLEGFSNTKKVVYPEEAPLARDPDTLIDPKKLSHAITHR